MQIENIETSEGSTIRLSCSIKEFNILKDTVHFAHSNVYYEDGPKASRLDTMFDKIMHHRFTSSNTNSFNLIKESL